MQVEWFVSRDNQQYGPLSSSLLKQWGIEGRITPETHVRKGKDGKWVVATKVKGLLTTASAAKPPTLVPTSEPQSVPVEVVSEPVMLRAQESASSPSCPYCGQVISASTRKCRHCKQKIRVRSGGLYTEEGARNFDKEKRRKSREEYLKNVDWDEVRRHNAEHRKFIAQQLREIKATWTPIEWLSGLKIVTLGNWRCCDYCRSQDGKVIPIEECTMDVLPPFRQCTSDGCRCSIQPVETPVRSRREKRLQGPSGCVLIVAAGGAVLAGLGVCVVLL